MEMTPAAQPASRSIWRNGIALGLAITLLGWSEVTGGWGDFGIWAANDMMRVLFITVAVVFYRAAPTIALGGVWLAGLIQVATPHPTLTIAQAIAVMVTCYGAARYGSRVVMWAAAWTVPAVILALYIGLRVMPLFGLPQHLHDMMRWLWNSPVNVADSVQSVGVTLTAALSIPWLIGWALRAQDRQAIAEQERDLAESLAVTAAENARLRADQARLARDVHDVVGHSLAVILAQAEASRFVSDDDIGGIREALHNVTEAARKSLRDVRQVLSGTADEPAGGTVEADVSLLIDSLRSGGFEVSVQEAGAERPLPPDLEVVVYRVVQEMVTNALKHAAKGSVVTFTRRWDRSLSLSMSNLAARERDDVDAEGMGLTWMRRRVEAVGGRMAVSRTPYDETADEHTVTVEVPFSGMEING